MFNKVVLDKKKKILAFQNPRFQILAFQTPDLKILAEYKILAFQNGEFKFLALQIFLQILGDVKILDFQHP